MKGCKRPYIEMPRETLRDVIKLKIRFHLRCHPEGQTVSQTMYAFQRVRTEKSTFYRAFNELVEEGHIYRKKIKGQRAKVYFLVEGHGIYEWECLDKAEFFHRFS
jgi:predicted transcriptional regulator